MKRTQAGFTLIELILATTLFAGLMTAYYQVFMSVLELEKKARDHRAFGIVGPAILDYMEDDLLSLYTHPRQADAFPFRGEDDSLASKAADRMAFVARRASFHQEEFYGDDRWVRSPINEVGYRLARGDSRFGDVRTLYRREGYYVDETPLQGCDYYEVYDRVVELDITYAGYRVEEAERTDQDTLGEHELDRFESWDSEERRGFPTAVIVRLTVEPPRMQFRKRYRGTAEEEPKRRTFVRIIPLVYADDIAPPQQEGAPTAGTQPSGTAPR
jgi:prepilin-type N-terminal cleavage/methylation domain-containing protein